MTTFNVEKMNCGGCARHVTKTVQKLQPDAQVTVDLEAKKVEVSPTPADIEAMVAAITAAGYSASVAA